MSLYAALAEVDGRVSCSAIRPVSGHYVRSIVSRPYSICSVLSRNLSPISAQMQQLTSQCIELLHSHEIFHCFALKLISMKVPQIMNHYANLVAPIKIASWIRYPSGDRFLRDPAKFHIPTTTDIDLLHTSTTINLVLLLASSPSLYSKPHPLYQLYSTPHPLHQL